MLFCFCCLWSLMFRRHHCSFLKLCVWSRGDVRHLHLLWLQEQGTQTKLCTTLGATWKRIRNQLSPDVLETLGKNLIPVCVQDPYEAKNFKAGSCSMPDPISLVGVQEVERFFPSFGGTSLTLVESLLRWNDARCSFACFPASHTPFLFFFNKGKKEEPHEVRRTYLILNFLSPLL